MPNAISLIEAAEPWTNPGRLGQYQSDLAWVEDSSHPQASTRRVLAR
jgi:hypothetical protein